MKREIRLVCSECNSPNVARDAWAMWDETRQTFEVSHIFDNGYCFTCEGEASLNEEEINDAT